MESTLKKELLDKIAKTDNEGLLELLNVDFEYFNTPRTQDSFQELSEKDNAELMEMLSQPFGEGAESYDEFKKAIAGWRTK